MMGTTANTWHSEFTQDELEAVRTAIRASIRVGHERSSRAQTAYADPDNDQDVYGAGMARAVQKEMSSRLASLDSYREEFTPGSRRKLMFVGGALIFPHRVGKWMPRNHQRIRLNYLPDSRRALLTKTSNTRYLPDGLFEFSTPAVDEPASLADVLAAVEASLPPVTLFVPYYASTAAAVGSVYWGPARLSGNHLELTSPERIMLERVPSTATSASTPITPAVAGFARAERKPTSVRLRRQHGADEAGEKP